MSAPKFIVGRKIGMTQIFTEDGTREPVTVVAAGPMTVAQVKTAERDGYLALQYAFEKCRDGVLTKPRLGHLKKAGEAAKEAGKDEFGAHRVLREVRLDEPSDLGVGDVVKADVFEVGDRVDVIGTVKGRGFTGTVKAHNFVQKRRTHGNMNQRGPGAIGMHSQPGEVLKGQRMPLQWGDERSTVRNLRVLKIDVENNALVIRGAIPGPRGSLVTIRKAKAYRERKS